MKKETVKPTFKRNDEADIEDASFHGVEITVSLETMTRLFGEPATGDGDKTQHEWIFEGEQFNVAVYDWKCDGAWHVGTETRAESLEFARWIRGAVAAARV